MFGSLFNRRALSLAVVSLLASSTAAEVFEHLSSVPEGWRYSRTPSNSQPIKLQVSLTQHDSEGFDQAVLDMSTPGHPNYGKHFKSHDEMKRMLQPRDDTVDAVEQWLQSAGISDSKRDADWLTFSTTVDKANTLLEADFKWYLNEARHVERLRTLEYSIPKSLWPHVNLISPTTRFGQLSPQHMTEHSRVVAADSVLAKQVAAGNVDCTKTITPQCLKDLYQTNNYKVSDTVNNTIGFANYLGQVPQNSDTKLFADNVAPWTKNQTYKVIEWNGGKDDQNSTEDSTEGNLDRQYIGGVSSPINGTTIIVGGRGKLVPDLESPDITKNDNEPYLQFFQELVKMDSKDLPTVISTSYGEDEQTIPEKYARTVCNLIREASGRGVSVIFSSGDSGIGAACQTNDGKNTTHFPPQFPAACPWVTAVGGTTGHPEKGVDFSSGGFSDLWERPEWQEKAVSSFLTGLGDKWKGLFNPKGRAFPDVAAQGRNFVVYEKGALKLVDGTSAAAPVFAAIIALLNDARVSSGNSTLGFLNPWLYQNPGILSDITERESKKSTGCDGHSRFHGAPNGSPVVKDAAWDCTKGWDPVTGLGTPIFPKMLEAIKKVPNQKYSDAKDSKEEPKKEESKKGESKKEPKKQSSDK